LGYGISVKMFSSTMGPVYNCWLHLCFVFYANVFWNLKLVAF
jgi:hypothetical protein